MSAAPELSIVVPAGEKDVGLTEAVGRYVEEMRRRGRPFEVVVVLDGVSEKTFRRVRDARPEGAEVRIVRLNHSFGESTALVAGLQIARGQVLVTAPANLQIEPQDLHRVLDTLDEEELDVVLGWRFKRVDPLLNRLQSSAFNALMRALTGVALHDVNSPLRAIRRRVFEDVTVQGDMVRFLPILAHRHGYRVGEARVRHVREGGKTGFFGVGVYVRRFLDVVNLLFLSRFTRAPLRFFGVGGFAAALIGFLICAWLTVDYLFLGGEPLRNRATLIVGVLLIILGVQVFAIGLVGEMIIYLQAKNLREYRTVDEAEEAPLDAVSDEGDGSNGRRDAAVPVSRRSGPRP